MGHFFFCAVKNFVQRPPLILEIRLTDVQHTENECTFCAARYSLEMKVPTEAYTVDPNIREQYHTRYQSFKSVMAHNYMDYPLQNCKDNKRRDTQAYIIRSIQVY